MSETTGTELIRQALRARNAKLNLSIFGRDLGLSGDQLHNFIFADATLTPEALRKLADYLWAGNTQWDEATDRLRPTKRQEPTPMGVLPQLDPKLLRKYRPGAAQTAHRLVNDSPPDQKPKTRPGWLGGWG
jgi:hypothetical protein